MRMRDVRGAVACGLLVAALLVSEGQAQGVTILYKSVPSAAELAHELYGTPLPEAQPPQGLRTRGLVPQGHEDAAAAAAPAEVEVHWAAASGGDEPVKKLAFNIQFDFDSTRIQADSRPYLDRLGEVLQATEGSRLAIVGHTDAVGPDDYNQRLSVGRAEAVRDYLVAQWRIAPERLRVDGRGEAELLTSIPPKHPTHRRVEFWAPASG